MSSLPSVKAIAASQPVRVLVYPLLVIILGFLAIKGFLDDDVVNIVVGILALAFGIPATEAVHDAVSPTTNLGSIVSTAVSDIFSAAEPEIRNKFGDNAEEVLKQIQGPLIKWLGRHHKGE